jgi:hypothetical protein
MSEAENQAKTITQGLHAAKSVKRPIAMKPR